MVAFNLGAIAAALDHTARAANEDALPMPIEVMDPVQQFRPPGGRGIR
jgi:hypothetical protein